MSEAKFTCPKCGGTRLEEVMINVTVSSNVKSMDIDDGEIDIEYGEQSNDDGEIECYQCLKCGYVVAHSQKELIQFLTK